MDGAGRSSVVNNRESSSRPINQRCFVGNIPIIVCRQNGRTGQTRDSLKARDWLLRLSLLYSFRSSIGSEK